MKGFSTAAPPRLWPRDCPITRTSGEPTGEGRLFNLLPSPKPRWKSFLTGWSAQALSLACLLYVSARFHEELVRPEHYRVTDLVSYEPAPLAEEKPVPPPAPRIKPAIARKPVMENEPKMEALMVTPQVKKVAERTVSEPEPVAPEMKLETRKIAIPAAPMPQIVATGTFAHDNPAIPVAAKPPAVVQPGGFGDPNGVPATGNHAAANIRESGAFDLKGSGKGTGAGSPSVVTNSGFGKGAIEAANTGIPRKSVSPHVSTGSDSPVEITFKPKPDYTDEGRKQKINGEVRLEVLFKSDGRIHVVRVLQGLGYGLDEQAVKAAEQIKFKPALREGQPIDSMALVHIIFELIS